MKIRRRLHSEKKKGLRREDPCRKLACETTKKSVSMEMSLVFLSPGSRVCCFKIVPTTRPQPPLAVSKNTAVLKKKNVVCGREPRLQRRDFERLGCSTLKLQTVVFQLGKKDKGNKKMNALIKRLVRSTVEFQCFLEGS